MRNYRIQLTLTLCALTLLASYKAKAQSVSFYEGRTAVPAIATSAIGTADFNGDGIIDTIVTTQFAVNVYPGQSNGSFGTPIITTLKLPCVSSLVVADFNKDGKEDFGCLLSNAFQVGLGNGDGTFQAPVVFAAGGAEVLTLSDFNGDGIPDLASYTTNSILVFLGTGTGSFLPAVATGTSYGQYSSIHPADMNADGKADIVATSSTTVAVLIGNGDGTFQKPTFTALKVTSANSVTTGDLNHDGKVDIVATVNQSASNLPVAHVAVLLQGTGGTFTPAYYVSQHPVYHPILADVTGDGLLDLITSTTYTSPTITIFPGAAGGTLGPPVAYDVEAKFFKVANPKHNVVPDIILSDGNTLQLLSNNGSGVFSTGVQVQGGVSSSPCLTGDFNNDGNPDLACLNSYFITILYGTGSQTVPFGAPQTLTLIGPAFAIALGDYNNDGNLDLVATLADDTVQFIENEGLAGFVQVSARSYGGTGLGVLATGDFNNDGKLDLITGAGYFLAGNGDGSFQSPVSFYAGTFAYYGVAFLNADGNLDLVGIPGGYAPPVILLGLGTGHFTPTVLTGIDGFYKPVITDLNGDGKMDIAIPAANFGVTILLNHGNGIFVAAAPIFNDFWPPTISIAVADVNGDGKPDITFGIADAVFPVLGNGDGTFGPTTTGFGVEDPTSLIPLALKGTGSSKPSLVAGSSVITILEAQ